MAEITDNRVQKAQFWLIDAIVGAVVVMAAASLVLTRIADLSMPESAVSSAAVPAADAMPAADADPKVSWGSKAAVMAAVNRVPAPVGTGLPTVTAITFEPTQVFPVLVRLEVQGMDNPAWDRLAVEDQRAYAEEVAQSVRSALPGLTASPEDKITYVQVGIWSWHRVPDTSLALEDLPGHFCRTQLPSDTSHLWECNLPEVSGLAEISAGGAER
jgi:hypothetical protein